MANREDNGVSMVVERQELREVVTALIHTVLFHRAYGEVRPTDVNCTFLELIYVRCDSEKICKYVDQAVGDFVRNMAASAHNSGEIVLDFFQRRMRGTLWKKEEKLIWEHWTFEFKIAETTSGAEREVYLQKLTERMTTNLSSIAKIIVEKQSHVPPVGDAQTDELVDNSLPERPFLHEITHTVGPVEHGSSWDTAKRMVTGVFSSGAV